MSRFYASIEGNRGPATRQGTADSGIDGHIRGWDLGVRVVGTVDGATAGQTDIFYVYATGGSNGSSERLIGLVTPEGFVPAVEAIPID